MHLHRFFRVYLSLVPVVHNRRIPGARCFAHSGCRAVTDVPCHPEKGMFRYLRRGAVTDVPCHLEKSMFRYLRRAAFRIAV